MRRPFLFFVTVVLVLVVAMWAFDGLLSPYGGWGMMGRGMWGGGYGPGMMSWQGPATARRGWGGWGGGWRDLNLSADNVKDELDRRLSWEGNPRLKVGNVAEKDADTIVADVVTKDGSLVQRFIVNRHNGYWRSSED